MSDVWIRRANAIAAGGYDYMTLAQIPLADASAFQASSLPSKGWAISSAPQTPTPPATVDAVGVMVFSGGPATPIAATTQTLFTVNGTINPVVDARYEFAAAGPLSTPLLGGILQVTSAPVTVPSGAQTAGISASWSTSGASLTANRISAERVQ